LGRRWDDDSILCLEPANIIAVEIGGGGMLLSVMGMFAVLRCKKWLFLPAHFTVAMGMVVEPLHILLLC
jgi:hypothetical protein